MVRVLVTGSNGSLGRVACTALQTAGHWVRGLDRAAGSGDTTYDRSATPDAQPDEFVLAEITDAAALAGAMESIDVVIHLAATPDDLATFDEPGGIMESNILGVYLVCDAARTAGVSRLMLASSVQAIQGLRTPDRTTTITLEDGTSPTNHYSLTKVFSEDIGQMYARGVEPRFAVAGEASPNIMSVVITRIGWFVRNTEEALTLAEAKSFGLYLSHDDAGRYFVRVVESQTPVAGDSAVLFAVSKCPDGMVPTVDVGPSAEVIGYIPENIFGSGTRFQHFIPNFLLFSVRFC